MASLVRRLSNSIRRGSSADKNIPTSPKQAHVPSPLSETKENSTTAASTTTSESTLQNALRSKRRGDVFVQHLEDEEVVDIPTVEKSETSVQFLLQALEKNVLFNELPESHRITMVSAMVEKSCKINEKLIMQGEIGDLFYVLEEGSIEFIVDSQKVGQGTPGTCFGELALLYNSPRAATVISKTPCKLWALPRDTFRRIVAGTVNKGRKETQKALRSVNLLQGLSDQQISQLCDLVTHVSFKKDDVIIRKGDEGTVFYFISKGTVTCTGIGNNDSSIELSAGEYFGERALMKSEPRAANVIAKTDNVDCIVLDKSDFDRYLGGLMKTLDHNLGMRVLKALPIFKDMSPSEKDAVVDEFQTVAFQPGQYIFRQGEHGDTFYIIKEGIVEVSKKVENTDAVAVIAQLKTGDYFGEGALLKDEPRGADVQAKSSVSAFVLDKEAFDRHMNGIKSNLVKKFSMRADAADDAMKKTKRGIEAQIKFSDLTQIRTLGTGTFGRVKLLEHKTLKMTFALKILQKAQVVSYAQQTNVLNEKNVMSECDHPFVLRLFKTFKDRNCLYMLLELVQGGELFSLLHTHGGKFADKQSRFYAACVLDALDYLHQKKIVYRDLKPENLMIDDVGYIKVVDFGFAKVIMDKSFTLCGTPEYLAPELVLQKGHDKGVDYWALGILIFEMLTGGSPFADPSGEANHLVICKNILRAKISFPSKFPDKAKDVTQQLLVREPHMRLGCLKQGAKEIKDHAWFKSLDFNELYRKRISAPWIPEIKGALDTSHFDKYDEDDNVEIYHGDDSEFTDF